MDRAIYNAALSVCPIGNEMFFLLLLYMYTYIHQLNRLSPWASYKAYGPRRGNRFKAESCTRGNWMIHEWLGREISYLFLNSDKLTRHVEFCINKRRYNLLINQAHSSDRCRKNFRKQWRKIDSCFEPTAHDAFLPAELFAFSKLLELHHINCRISSNILKRKQSNRKICIVCRRFYMRELLRWA